jgi:predicted nucleic acid-binding protein
LRGRHFSVPAHFDAEVYEALRKLDRRGVLSSGQLDAIVPTLVRFRAQRVPLRTLLPEAHALSPRFSARDALYVALARRLDAELFTRDRPLAGACAGVVEVRLL